MEQKINKLSLSKLFLSIIIITFLVLIASRLPLLLKIIKFNNLIFWVPFLCLFISLGPIISSYKNNENAPENIKIALLEVRISTSLFYFLFLLFLLPWMMYSYLFFPLFSIAFYGWIAVAISFLIMITTWLKYLSIKR